MPLISGGGSTFFAGTRSGAITNPNTLPNLQVWYDASDITQFKPTNPSDGAGITQWTDKSAAAHNASPSGGGAGPRPVYKTNIQNSLSVLRFNGTSSNLTINPATWAANLSGFTTYVVAKASSLSGTRTLTSSDQNGLKIFYDGSHWCVQTSGGTGTSTQAGDTTGFHIFGIIYDGSQTGNANRLKLRYNETEDALSFTGTVGATTSASTSVLNIGFYNNSEYFSGDIGEVVYFSKALSGSDIGGIESYLSNKWAI